MNKILILAGSFLLNSVIVLAQNGTLTINASNFETDKGVAVVNLFRVGDDIPEKPFMQLKAKIAEGKSNIVFNNIPYNDYAVIVFQDENVNGILDHRFGFPNEPMGFSNKWKLSLFSGMPTFKKLKFRFEEGKTYQEVVIPD
jgi:uncharacterized protein (DUF2141 family)